METRRIVATVTFIGLWLIAFVLLNGFTDFTWEALIKSVVIPGFIACAILAQTSEKEQ